MKLESTPYRVFYLINCPENTTNFRFLWNLDVERDDKGNQHNHYLSIVARMETEGDFSSVVVDTETVDEYFGPSGDRVDRVKHNPMPWDNLSDEVIELIYKFYDAKDQRDNRIRQISYADKIQNLLENQESVKVSVDSEGYPIVSVTGLPYLFTAGRSGDCSIEIKSDYHRTDYEFTIDLGRLDNKTYHLDNFSMNELYRKSELYDKLYKAIDDVLGINYYDDDDW